VFALFFASSFAEIVKVPSGTVVVVRPNDIISPSNYKSGDQVQFTVISDVKIGGKVIINSGALATGTITSSNESGMMGKPAQIQLSLNDVQAADETKIPLRAIQRAEGEDKQSETLILGILCFPLWLSEGGDTQIPQSITINSFTLGESEVTVE
jgi:hypothetical protein